MKSKPLAIILAICTMFSGCVALPPTDAPTSRVSRDYNAAGDISGIRAYLYGNKTVLEFEEAPLWVSIRDENGVEVPVEKVGRFYRSSRRLDKFSLWLNTRALSFTMAEKTPITPPSTASALIEEAGPVTLETLPKNSDDEATALLKLSGEQLDEVRREIAANKGNLVESKELTARLNRIEAQLVAAAAILVKVQFETEQTELKLAPAIARVLLPAAKAADRVNLRGRTDSRVAGTDDAKIALGRALAARKFLVDGGVDPAKVRVFSLAAGDFIAPSNTAEGRAMNRRVEIELVNRHYADLRRQATTLAQANQ